MTSAICTRSQPLFGRGHRVSKPNSRYADEGEEKKEEKIPAPRHWKGGSLPYPLKERRVTASKTYGKAPKHQGFQSEKPALSYGREYTTQVEFSSSRAQNCFLSLWKSIDRPRQDRRYVERCQRYFRELADTGSDPALKWVKTAPSKDPDLGIGVVAIQKIKEGTLIGHYAGVMQKISKSSSAFIFTFTGIDIGNWFIDAGAKGNVLSCVNANEQSPNVNVYEYYGTSGPRIIFLADKDIEQGEELFISYGPGYWKNMDFRPKNIQS